jgi:prepilin-type N-terminal cleavage/methylation domain-containing protein
MLAVSKRRTGFSLVELVVVIVIIGILAAMAIPRLSRGSAGAGKSAAQGNLAMIRTALSLYAAEHANAFPGPDEPGTVDKLTKYSNITGGTSDTKVGAFIYGPYLNAIPLCPVGPNTGNNEIHVDAANSPPVVAEGNGKGWLYNPDTGEFTINSDDTDEDGTAYNTD